MGLASLPLMNVLGNAKHNKCENCCRSRAATGIKVITPATWTGCNPPWRQPHLSCSYPSCSHVRRWLSRGVGPTPGIGWPLSPSTTPRVLEELSPKEVAAVISQKRHVIHMSFQTKDLLMNYVPFVPASVA